MTALLEFTGEDSSLATITVDQKNLHVDSVLSTKYPGYCPWADFGGTLVPLTIDATIASSRR